MHVRKSTQGITLNTTDIEVLAMLAALTSQTRRIDWCGCGLATADTTGRMPS